MVTQDDFWPAVDTKLEHARFFYTRMLQVLEPRRPTQAEVAMMSSGTIIGTAWQLRLFANLDAFLAMARSVPDIIQSSFGSDAVAADMRAWLKTLTIDEQQRRRDFTAQFKPIYDGFRDLPFSRARNATLHRTGETGTEVQGTTWFGVAYSGSAIEHVPHAATLPIPPGADLATAPPGAFRHPIAIEPKWSDFSFDGKPLYDQITAYLNEVSALANVARTLVNTVHGPQPLTPLPFPT